MPFCHACGKEIEATASFCELCGANQQQVPQQRPARKSKSLGEDAGMRMVLPVGRSGWAIASGYLGLLSFSVVCAPLAVITGILAISDIKKNPEKHGLGRAWFGIVAGLLMMGALAVVWLKR